MKYAKRAAPVLALAAVLILWELAVDLFKIPLYVLPSLQRWFWRWQRIARSFLATVL